MEYKKGTRIKHPNAPKWGVGEVLEDSDGSSVRVFFVGNGEVKLSLRDLELERVTGEGGKHPILDNLKLTTDKTLRYRTLPACIQRFLIEYPGGFYGEKFADYERDYKLEAHSNMTESLNEGISKSLLQSQNYEEINRRALKVFSASNFAHLHEKLALKNGLESSAHKETFAQTLYTYLFGDAPFKTRFNEFSSFLEEIKAAKWTVVTFFSFTMFPEQHMFLKPTVTNNAADICGFDIRYRPALNWETYDAVLRFSRFLMDELTRAELKPRDMIDVQSFMWCIRPDKSKTNQGKKGVEIVANSTDE